MNITRELWLRGLLLLLVFFCIVGGAGAVPPANWYRSDEGLTLTSSSNSVPDLFYFDRWIYVNCDNGLYVQLYNVPCFGWQRVMTVPSGVGSFQPVGNYLYGTGSDLWWVGLGDSDTYPTWHQVTSTGTPAGALIHPQVEFGGQLYAGVVSAPGSFDIYRTPDIGKTSMTWSKVVSAGFGDALNHELGCLIVYNNKLIAVTTNTRTDSLASFGDYRYYGTGIEVWESATGNAGSWTQVNSDGFGTEVTILTGGGSSVTIRSNQDFGDAAVYKGKLYIGTLSHFNRGEVWQYNGAGLGGWTDVTPDGLCAGMLGCGGPSRASTMAVYNSLLYLGEGVSTGNLETFDGTTWTIVVEGELDPAYMGHPFDPENVGIYGLAVFPSHPAVPGNPWTGDKLFALTKTLGGAQIWSYPFSSSPPTCTALRSATITIAPKSATSELYPGATHSFSVSVNAGPGFDFSQVLVGMDMTISQYYGGGGGSGTLVGFVPSSGYWTYTYTRSYQGLTALTTDSIQACFYNSERSVCDSAANTWIHTIPEIGAFRGGKWYVDANSDRAWSGYGIDNDTSYTFGKTGDQVLTVDREPGLRKTIAAFRAGTWYVDANANNIWDGTGTGKDTAYSFGKTGDQAVVSDWNRDGWNEIGVFRAGTWYVDANANNKWDGTGAGMDAAYSFGKAGDLAVAGDWNQDKLPEIGVFRAGTWYVDANANNKWDGTGAGKDAVYSFGMTGDQAFTGDWNRDKLPEIGVFRSGVWYVDANANNKWDGTGAGKDAAYSFGKTGDRAVLGIWT